MAVEAAGDEMEKRSFIVYVATKEFLVLMAEKTRKTRQASCYVLVVVDD